MLARIWKVVSNNPLVYTIVGTFIGTVLATQYVAWKAPDLSGVLGAVGGWLRGPSGSTRVNEITLVLLALLLGILSCAAAFLRDYPEQRQRKQPAPAAAPQVRFAPESFELTPARARAAGAAPSRGRADDFARTA